jgi:hypothetical protein
VDYFKEPLGSLSFGQDEFSLIVDPQKQEMSGVIAKNAGGFEFKKVRRRMDWTFLFWFFFFVLVLFWFRIREGK